MSDNDGNNPDGYKPPRGPRPGTKYKSKPGPKSLAEGGVRLPTWYRPGQSGNPGGVHMGIRERARAAMERGKHPIDFLEQLVSGALKATNNERIEASKVLLDRGYGKPVALAANVELDQQSLGGQLSDDTLGALVTALMEPDAVARRTVDALPADTSPEELETPDASDE